MNIDIEPQVFLIGEMQLNNDIVTNWLTSIGGVEILDSIEGSDNEQLIELFARRCYKSFKPRLNPNVTKITEESEKYHANIQNQRHGSVVAHGNVSFAIENVSRVFTHELVRNRIGTEFSQESLRYVRLTDINMWIPDIIKNETRTDMHGRNPLKILIQTLATLEEAQKCLAEVYDIDNIKDFATKKKLTSTFRRILPIGIATGICVSFNLRSLRWIIEQRTDPAAEIEMRTVFHKIGVISMERWPFIFQDFEWGESEDGISALVPRNSKI